MHIILRGAFAVDVGDAEAKLSGRIALRRSFVEPVESDDLVLRHAFAVGIHQAEVTLGIGIRLRGGLAKPAQRLSVVLRGSLALVIHEPQHVLGVRIPFVRERLKVLECRCVVVGLVSPRRIGARTAPRGKHEREGCSGGNDFEMQAHRRAHARSAARIGSLRTRTPVAAKTALASAGAVGGTAVSPQPLGMSDPAMKWTSIGGASLIRSTGKSLKFLWTMAPCCTVISCLRAAERPKMIEPSICAVAPKRFTTRPMSAAATTRRPRISRCASTSTSATTAT